MAEVIAQPLGSAAYARHAKAAAELSIRDLPRPLRLNTELRAWPRGLYIPASARPTDYWPFGVPPGAANRYAMAWTNGSIGSASANKDDGSLFALASTPTARGAIDGTAEAGLGVIFTTASTLSRVRIAPDLNFVARHEWNVTAGPTVTVITRVVATIFVGGFILNPATKSYEPIPNFTLHRQEIFRERNQGLGATQMVTFPFMLPGAAAAAEVQVQSGRTYLLAVIAQIAMRVTTEDGAGRHVEVRDGSFNTWGSLAGKVPQIWLQETVFIP